jgi:disulfide bond formation protein DsbB
MKLLRTTDMLAMSGIALSLLIAFYFQLMVGELPCALCNLQRVAFLAFSAGLLLNIRYGHKPWNYLLCAGAALVGSLTGLLQMFVHVLPGTPPTGTSFLGLHMYAWTYVILTLAFCYALVALAYMASGKHSAQVTAHADRSVYETAIIAAFVILTVGNLISAFLENGFHPFKGGGQQHYQMLYDGDIMKP